MTGTCKITKEQLNTINDIANTRSDIHTVVIYPPEYALSPVRVQFHRTDEATLTLLGSFECKINQTGNVVL